MRIWKTLKRDYRQLLFICIAFLAMALVSYFYAASLMRRQLDLLGGSEMLVHQIRLKSLILAHEAALRHAVASVGMAMKRNADPDELWNILRELTGVFRDQKDIKDVFVSVYGYLNGNYLDGTGWIPGEFYTAKTAPWFRGAIIQNDIFHSRPYVNPRTSDVVSAISLVVLDGRWEGR